MTPKQMWSIGMALALVALSSGNVDSANTVIVESKAVGASATNVAVRIRVSNDETIARVRVPLIIRSVTAGSFITSLQVSYGERLPISGPLSSVVRNHYATANGICKPVDGFGTVSFSDGLSHPVTASPEGVLFNRIDTSASDYLNAGSDVSGSLILTMSVTSTLGTFEIDTTCTDPGNHLSYYGLFENTIVPAFTKGIITIGADFDGDQVPDITDNCPTVANNSQLNGDGDALGDACDTLRLTAFSPVDLIAISPSGGDSVGPRFNTLGGRADTIRRPIAELDRMGYLARRTSRY